MAGEKTEQKAVLEAVEALIKMTETTDKAWADLQELRQKRENAQTNLDDSDRAPLAEAVSKETKAYQDMQKRWENYEDNQKNKVTDSDERAAIQRAVIEARKAFTTDPGERQKERELANNKLKIAQESVVGILLRAAPKVGAIDGEAIKIETATTIPIEAAKIEKDNNPAPKSSANISGAGSADKTADLEARVKKAFGDEGNKNYDIRGDKNSVFVSGKKDGRPVLNVTSESIKPLVSLIDNPELTKHTLMTAIELYGEPIVAFSADPKEKAFIERIAKENDIQIKVASTPEAYKALQEKPEASATQKNPEVKKFSDLNPLDTNKMSTKPGDLNPEGIRKMIEDKYPVVPRTTTDGPLTNGHWYSNFEINSIISATEHAAGQEGHYPNNIVGMNDQTYGEIVTSNKKFYGSLTPVTVNSCKNEVEAEVNKFLTEWNKKHTGQKENGTLVFATHVGNNHYATYACNTKGEILAINSLGGEYAEWDKAAIEGMQAAFKNKKIESSPEQVIRITPDSKGPSQQDGSICGGITAAISVAISSDSSFKDQKASLEGHMKKLCGKDSKHYPEIRKEQQKLIDIYKGAIEPGEANNADKVTQGKAQKGKEDIRDYRKASEYHKPSDHKAPDTSQNKSKNLQSGKVDPLTDQSSSKQSISSSNS